MTTPGVNGGTATAPSAAATAAAAAAATAAAAAAVGRAVPFPPTPGPSSAPYLVPAGAFDVTRFGAKGDGITDSAPGIQAAIDAAQAVGGMAFIPPGHYFDRHGVIIKVKPGGPVTVAGAGRDQTFLVQGPGGQDLLSVKADHSVVQDLSLDTHAYNAGSAFITSANFVTLQRARAVGDTTEWAVRFAGGQGTATPGNPSSYAVGNVVNDLVLHDYALPWNDGLDFSYQSHASISNVNHIGSRLGLYVDSYVTVTNYTFAPEPTLPSGWYGYYITSPGDHITITNFTSSGQGGHIGTATPGSSGSHDITIVNERMTSMGSRLFVGDVLNCVIVGSSLGILEIKPDIAAQVTVRNTSYASLLPHGAAGTMSITLQ